MGEGGADGLDERSVTHLAQPPWVEGRQPPVLPGGVELVGWRAHPHPLRHHVLPHPGVGAGRVEAHGEVVDQRRSLRRRRQLLVEQPLEPRVEADAVVVFVGKASDGSVVGMAVPMRPLGPRLGQLLV